MAAHDKNQLPLLTRPTPQRKDHALEIDSSVEKGHRLPKDKQEVTLTPVLSRQLDQRIKDFFNNPEQGVIKYGDAQEAPSIFLSRFGLKTPKALETFLRTPAGETVIGEIGAELALEKAIEDERRFQQREHDLLMRRIKISLFLWFLERKAHALDKIKELVRDQIEQSMERLHKAAEQPASNPKVAQRQADLLNMLDAYDKLLKNAQDRKQFLAKEEQDLMDEFNLLKTLGINLKDKYDLYESHADDEKLNGFADEEGNAYPEKIRKAHAALTAQMLTLYEAISQLVDNDGDPTILMQDQNALNLEYANLHDLMDVHDKKKYYADGSGEKVLHAKAASFILNVGDKLIYDKEKGQYYLLKPNQDWDAVKDNPEAREAALTEAKENFSLYKAEIMTVKRVINHHRDTEDTAHQDKVALNHMARGVNTAEQRLLDNQVTVIQALRSEAQAEFRHLTATMNANNTGDAQQNALALKPPTPTPTATRRHHSHASHAPKPTPQPVKALKDQIEHLRNNMQIPLTKDLLLNLARAPGVINQAAARQFIENLFKSGANFTRATPLLRERLFQQMLGFGVEGPLTKQNIDRHFPEPSTAPTPFNMNPLK